MVTDVVLVVVRHVATIGLCGVATCTVTTAPRMVGRRSAMNSTMLASALVPTTILTATSEQQRDLVTLN